MPPMNSREQEILAEFEEIKSYLSQWGTNVDSTLINIIAKDMVDNSQIKISPKYRIKDDKSYLFKALYRKKNYRNPIVDIEDKIGTRIIVLKSSDISIIQDRILEYDQWESKLTKNLNQEIEDKPNIFDYQSSHVVVNPKSDNQGFPTEVIPKLTCEVSGRASAYCIKA